MVRKIDLTGKRFGRLTVQGDVGRRSSSGKVLWHCICDCNRVTFVRTDHLNAFKILSCGCLGEEKKVSRFKDLTGYENENFKVFQKSKPKNKRVMWLCECKHCNSLIELHSNTIDLNKSCGCLRIGVSKEYMESIRDVESLKSTKPTKRSTTGIRGVYFNKKKQRYEAFINVNKKRFI